MEKFFGIRGNMDDLKFPTFKESLPPPRKMGNKAYLEFVMWHLNQMNPRERKRRLARRPIPAGERFSLFPDKS